MTPCTSAFYAIAQIGRLSAGDRAPVTLVVVEPDMLDGVPSVIDAIRRHVKRTTPCWMYSASSSPKLRPITTDDLDAWRGITGGAASAECTPGPMPEPKLIPTDASEPVANDVRGESVPDSPDFDTMPTPRSGGDALRPTDEVTDDELSMLRGEDSAGDDDRHA